jgi:hypothetical protein
MILDRFDRVAKLNESFFAKKSREKHSFCPCSSHPYVSQNTERGIVLKQPVIAAAWNNRKQQLPIVQEKLAGGDGEVVTSSASSITARSRRRCTTATSVRIRPITVLVVLSRF